MLKSLMPDVTQMQTLMNFQKHLHLLCLRAYIPLIDHSNFVSWKICLRAYIPLIDHSNFISCKICAMVGLYWRDCLCGLLHVLIAGCVTGFMA